MPVYVEIYKASYTALTPLLITQAHPERSLRNKFRSYRSRGGTWHHKTSNNNNPRATALAIAEALERSGLKVTERPLKPYDRGNMYRVSAHQNDTDTHHEIIVS